MTKQQAGIAIGAALVSAEVRYGFGMHQNCLNAHQLQEFQKYVYGEWIQTFASLMWTKVSICLFLLRIPITKRLIRPLQLGVVVLILSNVVLTLCWILQCRPLDAAWNTTIKGQCLSRGQKQRIILAQASRICPLLTSSSDALIFVKSSQWPRILLSQPFQYCFCGMFKSH